MSTKTGELAAIKSEHFKDEEAECDGCFPDHVSWPCRTWRLADRAERAEREVERLTQAVEYAATAFEQRDATVAELETERARMARVQLVRRAMGYAAEAWTLSEQPLVAERLQHFSDLFAEAMADTEPVDPYARSADV